MTHRQPRREAAHISAQVSAPSPATPRPLRKVLVANRGEIACRVLRTCRAMGLATVAVFSEADAAARHAREADEAVRIGPSAARASYLNIPALLAAAQRTGADAIHPGYGFLSENAAFAAACREAGLTFIGPAPEVIARMGSKREARRLMSAVGVPVVPGYDGAEQSDTALTAAAARVGYPLLVKASAGGGGKGMRTVTAAEELPTALAAARREARAAFGDETLLLEKLIPAPRHIEFQIFGDTHGHLIHLGERECSIQRRHQKVIEETPSTALTPDLRARMAEAALTVGRQLGYTNAGTVEFILAPDGAFYFLEVNTRLQVEHPVTELVTGLDLVRWQILVAEGRPLPLAQDQLTVTGHAIEARVYAEDPARDFLPATGRLALWRTPSGEGVRVDAGVRTGDEIGIYYDPLLAKITAHGADRPEALRRLERALGETVLLGVRNNLDFLRRVLAHPTHMAGQLSTSFIERHRDALLAPPEAHLPLPLPICAAVLAALARAAALRDPRGWGNNAGGHSGNNSSRPMLQSFSARHPHPASSAERADEERITTRVTHHPGTSPGTDAGTDAGTGPSTGPGSGYAVDVAWGADSDQASAQRTRQETRQVRALLHECDGVDLLAELDGHLLRAVVVEATPGELWVRVGTATCVLTRHSILPEPAPRSSARAAGEPSRAGASAPIGGPGALVAPMPGQILAVLVDEGQTVRAGDPVLLLEAMKMEHTLRAPRDGIVTTIRARAGEQAQPGAILLDIAPTEVP